MSRTDYELLSYDLGGVKLTEASTITFLGWVAKKINNVTQNTPAMSELAMMVKNPPIGRLSDDSKISLIRKMEAAGIEL